MKSFTTKVAAITGAGSGIGRALAVSLAREGASLALSDVNAAGLAETAAECTVLGADVTTDVLDVADRDAVFAWADKVVELHGGVNLIFNNAGVALGATIDEMDIADFEWLMNINFWGVVHGTQAFLPHLEASGDGHVINISSVFGLLAIPTQSAYNASKFAVRGFTDALRIELEARQSCVSSTTIHPGGIKTNIARDARMSSSIASVESREEAAADFEKLARTTPDEAAEQILTAVRKNKRRALIGPDAKALDLISRLPAGLSQRVLARGARRRAVAETVSV